MCVCVYVCVCVCVCARARMQPDFLMLTDSANKFFACMFVNIIHRRATSKVLNLQLDKSVNALKL